MELVDVELIDLEAELSTVVMRFSLVVEKV